jgi:hypothetical protein
MTRRCLVPMLLIALALAPSLAGALPPESKDADLALGIRQVRQGDLDAALITLDGVVKRLSAQKGQSKELARAYTYLAIAYVGLAQQERAKSKFLEAWRADNSLTLSPEEFPPSIIEFFEQAKRAGEEEARAAPVMPPKAPQAAQASPQGKGRSAKLPLILGAAAVAGGGIALLAASGGDSGTPTPPNTPTVLTFAFSGGTQDRVWEGRFSVPGAGSLLVTAHWTRAFVDLDLYVRDSRGQEICTNSSPAERDQGSTSCTGRVNEAGTYTVGVAYLDGPDYPGSTEPESGTAEVVYSP